MAHAWQTAFKQALFITGSGNDDLLDAILLRVQRAVERYTGLILIDPGSDVTEYRCGDATRFVYTERAPIKSVTSVYIDATRQWTSTYELTSDFRLTDLASDDPICKAGQIRIVPNQSGTGTEFSDFAAGVDNVRIIYRPGWAAADTPDDLQSAVFIIAADRFKKWERKQHGVSKLNMTDGSLTIFSRRWPEEALEILEPWIRRGYGG